MQMTIDIDKTLIENLKKEFSVASPKEALYQLLDFYKKNNNYIKENLDTITKDDADYAYITDARERRENGEKIESIDSVLKEFE